MLAGLLTFTGIRQDISDHTERKERWARMADLWDFPYPSAVPCTFVCQHMRELIVFEVSHNPRLFGEYLENRLPRPRAQPTSEEHLKSFSRELTVVFQKFNLFSRL